MGHSSSIGVFESIIRGKKPERAPPVSSYTSQPFIERQVTRLGTSGSSNTYLQLYDTIRRLSNTQFDFETFIEEANRRLEALSAELDATRASAQRERGVTYTPR